MLNKLTTALQILTNILIVILGTWIIFYAFQTQLPNLIGGSLFARIYSWLSTLISIFAALLIIVTFIYVLAAWSDKNQR